ncbi:MAG: hypothetical protein IJ260_11440, partial [Butyrivibrio sp.]|nr:hypothetical protein [Butyrivibrio sp.]
WAFTLSLKNLTMTLTMMFVIIAAIWLCHLIPGLIFIMFGIVAQFNASIFAVIFKPYLPKPFFMEEDDFMANTADETYASFYEGTYASLSDKNNVGYSDKSEASPADKTYSDFDEAAFYGEDPEEVARLLKEYETTQSHADF